MSDLGERLRASAEAAADALERFDAAWQGISVERLRVRRAAEKRVYDAFLRDSAVRRVDGPAE